MTKEQQLVRKHNEIQYLQISSMLLYTLSLLSVVMFLMKYQNYIKKMQQEANRSKRMRVEKCKVLTFNDRQRQFVKYVLSCCKRKESGVIVVNSPGGTGKTFCIKQLIGIIETKSNKEQSDRIIGNYEAVIQVVAPTHKATSLFRNTASIKAITVHKFFKSVPRYDCNGEPIYEFTPPKELINGTYKIIFVDECSMINEQMLEGFRQCINLCKPCLIVFMGDEMQLPPVQKETLSKEQELILPTDAFSTQSTKIEYDMSIPKSDKSVLQCAEKKLRSYKLSPVFYNKHGDAQSFRFIENVRAKNFTVGRLIDYFRWDFREPIHFNKTQVFSEVGQPQDLLDTIDDIAGFQGEKVYDFVYLTWTNKKKDIVNETIRKRIHGEECPQYLVGEKLVFSGYKDHFAEICFPNSVDKLDYLISKENLLILARLDSLSLLNKVEEQFYSSDELIVSGTKEVVGLYFDFIGFSLNFTSVEFTRNEQLFRWLLPDPPSFSYLKSFFDTAKKLIKDRHQSLKLLEENLFKTKDELKKEEDSSSPDYDNLKRLKEIIINLSESIRDMLPQCQNDWKNYYLTKSLLCPKLDYTYAMTVHKSQGSQWKFVYVDIEEMFRSPFPRKMIYTAVSRAEEAVAFTK